MTRSAFATVLILLILTAAAPAQSPPRHLWQTGQVLVYKAEHATLVIDSVGEAKAETKSVVNVTRRWQVLGVDAAGVATLQLSLTALRIETTTPKNEVLLFDSANPDKSNPDMQKQLSSFVGQPVALLRVDASGKVVEVKESKFGPASRFEMEPPFAAVLPGAMPQANQAWERAYKVTGIGETFDAVQRYTCKSVAADALTFSLATEIKAQPEAVADRIPLLQSQPEGEIVFDVQAGRLKSATLKIDKELKGHQGEGSSYRFMSAYTEVYVGDK